MIERTGPIDLYIRLESLKQIEDYLSDSIRMAALSQISKNESTDGRARQVTTVLSVTRDTWPGLAACGAIALLGMTLHRAPGFGFVSPLMLSMIIGAIFANIFGANAALHNGIRFSIRRILRLAIIMLGFQITFQQLGSIGGLALCVVALCLAATLLFTRQLGPLLGVDAKLAELIAVGTAICGASAIVAANVITEGEDEDVAYAIGCVTIFGCLAAFVCPLLLQSLELSQRAYGLWVGSSIHEIAQVVASAFQVGDEAGRYGTIAKLSRVAMLAPAIIALATIKRSGDLNEPSGNSGRSTPLPYFVLGFVAMIAVNSTLHISEPVSLIITQVTNFLMSVSLAAMGLETRLRVLRKKGVRPLLLGGAGAVFISLISLVMIKLLHPV